MTGQEVTALASIVATSLVGLFGPKIWREWRLFRQDDNRTRIKLSEHESDKAKHRHDLQVELARTLAMYERATEEREGAEAANAILRAEILRLRKNHDAH